MWLSRVGVAGRVRGKVWVSARGSVTPLPISLPPDSRLLSFVS